MKIKPALLLHTVVAPREVAQPVVTTSFVDGNPIPMKDADAPGWVVMRMKLRSFEQTPGANRSLIVTRIEPKQLARTDGSQGEYLRCIRARMLTWLQGGGDPEKAAARMVEYKGAEQACTRGGDEWGAPRATGRAVTAKPPVPAGEPHPRARGRDREPRKRRRDLYIVYTAPHGEEIRILASSRLGKAMMADGAPEPEGWSHRLETTESPLDKRPLLRRVMAVRANGQREEMARAIMKMVVTGKSPLNGRVPTHPPM